MITMIWGYPGSGKSTLAEQLARSFTRGAVLDLDALVAAMTGVEIHAEQPDRRVVFAVDQYVWQLAREIENRGMPVYVIRTAPGAIEHEEYARFCARIYVDTPLEVCRERCKARGDYDPEGFEAARRRVDEYMRFYGDRTKRIRGWIPDARENAERELEIVRHLGAKRETEGDIDERDGDSGAPV